MLAIIISCVTTSYLASGGSCSQATNPPVTACCAPHVRIRCSSIFFHFCSGRIAPANQDQGEKEISGERDCALRGRHGHGYGRDAARATTRPAHVAMGSYKVAAAPAQHTSPQRERHLTRLPACVSLSPRPQQLGRLSPAGAIGDHASSQQSGGLEAARPQPATLASA